MNEQIKIIANKVLRSPLNGIQPQCLFSLLADETRDVSNREQLIICTRWVSDTYEVVHEDCGPLAPKNCCQRTHKMDSL